MSSALQSCAAFESVGEGTTRRAACRPVIVHIAPPPSMSIAPGIPLQLTTATNSKPSLLVPTLQTRVAYEPTSSSTSASHSKLQTLPTSHIAASPSALSAQQQSTSTLLAELLSSRPVCTTTDVEDLIVLDGSARRRPPVVPAYCPYRVQLQVGRTYRWCSCGRSSEQPWCDDSHTDSDPQPLAFQLSVKQKLHYVCGCKFTSKPPWCDGSHIYAVAGAEEQRSQRTASAT